jgi:hypothetical protein
MGKYSIETLESKTKSELISIISHITSRATVWNQTHKEARKIANRKAYLKRKQKLLL